MGVYVSCGSIGRKSQSSPRLEKRIRKQACGLVNEDGSPIALSLSDFKKRYALEIDGSKNDHISSYTSSIPTQVSSESEQNKLASFISDAASIWRIGFNRRRTGKVVSTALPTHTVMHSSSFLF